MKRITALFLALALLLSACSRGPKATSMRLRRAEGDVEVTDKEDKALRLREDMGLYNGYGVNTARESFAWIDLDETKLLKMDEDTDITIHKRLRWLTVDVEQGSLFFHVTEPLEESETMEIQASDLLVGIRGTCGWVENRGDTVRVYLLEGKVECEAGKETVTVRAGEMAELTPDGQLRVEAFTRDEIPAYILSEIADEPALLDALPDVQPEEPPAEEPPAEEPPAEPEPEIDHQAAAAEQYQALIDDAASNDYNPSGLPGIETGNYQYAYAAMQADNDIPALLLAAEYLLTADEMASPGTEPFYYQYHILVFQYDKDSGTVMPTGLNLREGALEDGRVSELSVNGSEAGLWMKVHQAGSDDPVTLYQVAVSERFAGEMVKIYEGPKNNMPAAVDTTQALPCQGIGEYVVPEIVQEYEANPPGPPTDGNRIVFAGTVHTYTHEQLLQLQGISNDVYQSYDYYRMIILDSPIMMNLLDRSNGGLSSGMVSMICVNWADYMAQYEGQHLYFSIDPYNCWWPTDPTLPSEQPRTGDVHVLS